MKPKNSPPLAAVALFVLMAALPCQAQFTYTTNTDGSLTITGSLDCASFGEVSIPNTINGTPVTSIGDYAFQGCYLTALTIPGSVTTIGYKAFYGCQFLSSVSLAEGVLSIGPLAFFSCFRLSTLTLPNSLTSIGDLSFMSCSSLQAVTLPSRLTSIGPLVFRETGLTNLTLPETVTTIADGAFENCGSLTNITIPESVAYIGGFAFAGSALTTAVIPDSVTYLGSGVFDACSSLKTATLPNGLSRIGDDTFAQCWGLSSITIPAAVTAIGRDAFVACSALTNIHLPEGLTNIGDQAFFYCGGLTTVTISTNITYIGIDAFNGCLSLTNITVDALNAFYKSVDGVLFTKDQRTLMTYPPSKAQINYVVPPSVTTIQEFSFDGCTNLTALIISSSVTNIGTHAFASDNFSPNKLNRVFFLGNAPVVAQDIFYLAVPILYYLPGTTGWYSPFAGRPAVLWNPVPQSTDGSFGVGPNGFGFNITGTTNIPMVVEASTSLANPAWVPLLSGTLTNGSVYFSDPQWSNYPARFYRIRSP